MLLLYKSTENMDLARTNQLELFSQYVYKLVVKRDLRYLP